MCPAWLADRRDDIIQSALIRIANISAREGNAPLAASYLWKTAYSATVDEIRRVRRLRESTLEDGAGDVLPAADMPVPSGGSRAVRSGPPSGHASRG